MKCFKFKTFVKEIPDFIFELKDRGSIRKDCTNLADLNEKELNKYKAYRQEYKNDMYNNTEGIKRCLIKNLGFRRPELINIDSILQEDGINENLQIYVIPMLMRPGR